MPTTSSRRSIAIAPAGDGKADQRHHFQYDLVACAHRQLLFLTLLHSQDISIRRPKVASLRRYVHLWLPLVAKQNNPSNDDDNDNDNDDAVELIPPADVAWLWHVHRLAPSQYKHHIRSTGLVDSEEGYLDANPPFALQFVGIASSELDGGTGPSDNTESLFDDFDIEAPSAASSSTDTSTPESATRELWRKEYPSEPFFLEDYERDIKTSLADELDGDDDTLVSGYDLLDAAERQSTFLWQVSRSCFRQDKFLREGVDQYHKFLLLWQSAKKIHSLIPTYQIDFIWHSHMLSSTKKYDEDCDELIGCEFDHDDSLDDRSERSSEFIAYQATKSLWERTYGTKYEVKDAMFRGPPPASYFSGTRSPYQVALHEDETHRKISRSPNAIPASSSRLHTLKTTMNQRLALRSGGPTSIPSSQHQAPTTSASEWQDFHFHSTNSSSLGVTASSVSPRSRFAHAIGLNRLSPSEVRREAHTSTYSRIQCKFFFFGVLLIGLSFLPLFYPDKECSDCVPCPDDKENSRPEDFAFRVVIASLCLIPGAFLLSFAALWKFGIISLSDACLGCLISNCKGDGGCSSGTFGGGGGCGGGGCGGC